MIYQGLRAEIKRPNLNAALFSPSGGGSGGGTVKSVNEILPDGNGNVRLDAGNIPFNESNVGEKLEQQEERTENLEQTAWEPIDKDSETIIMPGIYIAIYDETISRSSAGDQGAQSLYFQCLPNTTYKIKKRTSQVLRIVYTKSTPGVGVRTYGYSNKDGYTDVEFTTGEDAAYIVVNYYIASIETDPTAEQVYESISIYSKYITANDKTKLSKFILIWENASPTSNVGDLNINGSGLLNYDFLIFLFMLTTTNQRVAPALIIPKGNTGMAIANIGGYISFRSIGAITQNQIRIFNANIYRTYGDSTLNEDSTRLIPYKIYGFNGVALP